MLPSLIRIVAVCAGLFSVAGYSNTLSWSGGGGANANWNNSANWGFAGTPANGDTLIFSASQPNLLNTNNIAGLTLNQIRFAGAGGGYDIRGNAFTLTNSIMATNTAGANTIENNITLATSAVRIVVSNGVSLTLDGNLNGSVGVNKAGLGTLTYQGPGDNTYTGTTLVSGGTLQLNVGGYNAFEGPLVIGDGTGTGSPTVQDLIYEEISEAVPITINVNGTLNLNGNNETIGTNLTLFGGTIQTGTGTLTLAANSTITVAGYGASYIYGNLNIGSGTLTLQGNGAALNVNATVSGSANIVQNGCLGTGWYSANTYSGNFTVNGCSSVDLISSLALGNPTNAMTLNGQASVQITANINITNQSLTINSTNPYALYVYGTSTNSWQANFTLGSACTIDVETNCALNLIGPIGGSGGVTKIGQGRLVYAGTNNNTYAGLTTVNQGELDLAKSGGVVSAIPPFGLGLVIGDGVDAAIVRNYGSAQIWGFAPMTITNSGVWDLNNYYDSAAPLTLNGGQITTGSGFCAMINTVNVGASSTVSGNVRLDSPTVVFSDNANLYMNASVSSYAANYGLAKAGVGYMYLSASNSYGGLTQVQGGMLYVENPLALGGTNSGTVVSSGASLVLDGNVCVTNEALTLNGLGASSDWGALDVESGIHTWAGPVTNNANSTLDAWNSGSELHINGPISGGGGLELFGYSSGGGTHFFEGSAANTYAGTTTVDAGTTLVLNNTAFDGAIPHDLNINGTVRNLHDSEINNSSTVTIGPSGLLDLSGGGDGIGSLNGSGSVNLGANYVNSFGSGSHTYSGVISGSGEFDVAANNITYTLNGNNTYTGLTRLYDGYTSIVKINDSQPQSPVYVGNLATLGGSGTVGTITANGIISPGNSPGILTSSNVTFSASGIFSVELTGPTPGSGYDQLNVRGTNNLASAMLNLNLAFTTPVAIGQQFTIINNDGTDPITGIFAGYPQGSTWLQNGYKVLISYVGGTGNDVMLTLTSIPGAVTGSTVTSGNGSHGIDPNDCNNLSLVITNTAGTPMTGINATLSTTTEGVLITQPYATYPNIPANGSGTNIAPFQISTLPSFVCGNTINLQLIVNSSLGSFTMNYVLNTGESAAPTRFDNNTITNVPDIGTIESTNNVTSWSGGPITKVTVSLWLVAPIDSDLNLSLISPDGTTVPLSTANGAGANFGSGSADASRTTFDDSAATAITAGSPPFVGTFRPQSPLSAFIGTSPFGAWRLHIQDSFGSGSPDTLRAWSLFLSGTSCNTGSGICDLCMPAITNAITLSDPVQTGRWIGNSVVASCGTPKTWAGTSAGSLHYDVYTFTNTSPADACVTVELQSPSNILATAYLNSFNPASITSNYLGDAGNSTHGGQTTFSCTVPAGATLWVVVTEVIANAGTQPYTLQLSGLPCPPPTLSIQPVPANKARLYWPTWAGGYKLEATPSLLQTNWAYVTNEPIVSALKYNVTNSAMNPTNRFYRLHKP